MRALVIVALLASVAHADPVTVSGAPAADQSATVAAIEKVRALMSVCWQKKPPAKVQIAVQVASSGDVVKANAKTKGAAAQCAAGILAVSTVAAPSKAWKGTVTIEAAAGGKAADAVAIHEDLAKHGDVLFGCQSADAGFAGAVALRVTVAQNGKITDASATPAGKIADCLVAAVKKLTLSPIQSDSVSYDLTLTYAGGGGGAAAAADPSLQPQTKGPLQPEDLQPVFAARASALAKCGKGSQARGKVVVRVSIGTDGKSSAKVKSSELDDVTVEGCFVKALTDLSFKKAGGETVVLYPIRVDDDGVKTGG